MGGQYGIIVSIDVELINESKPITKYYAVKVTNNEVKTIINILCNNDDLNSKGICMSLFYNNKFGNFLIIVCQYNKKLFNKNLKLVINKALDKNILPVSYLLNFVFTPDWSKLYKYLYKNKWNEYDFILQKKDKDVINKLINLCLSNNRTIMIHSRIKYPIGLSK